ncbi:MAG: hypothetical protein J5865_03265 [Lachnospiraceae bacterium]|nr:hypothetical protein [Lachnospiraceae bacterium]
MSQYKRCLALLLAVLMIALAGCGPREDPTGAESTSQTGSAAETTAPVTETAKEPATETTEEPATESMSAGESSAEEPSTEDLPGVLQLEQLEDCLDWIGKTAKKAGIPNKRIFREDGVLTVKLEGSLFGRAAQGSAALEEGAKKTKVAQVQLTCGELSYEEAKAALTARYGEPVEEKTDRSGQTAQGDVTWAVFENGKSEVWLSKGNLEDFIRVEAY